MSLVPISSMLHKAEAGGYAVGAFNCNNMEIVQAIIAAAEAENSPVIMQASQGAIKYAGIDYVTAIAGVAAAKAKVPVALHLDHGTSFEQVVECIRSGFSSVMIDGSKLPLEENIAITRKVLEAARAVGVSVEAELGRIGGTEDDISVSEKEAFFTNPAEAEFFVRGTGVDALAVAVGTAHGQYRGVPKLELELLKKIKEKVKIPLVLHGSSGVPEDAIREAIAIGISKVNIDTDIRIAFCQAVRDKLDSDPKEIDPRQILGPAREAAIEIIREKIRIFGSAGKA